MLSSNRSRRVMLNAVTMRPIQLAYDLSLATVEEIEALVYQGFAYSVCADRSIAVLTTPRADEDIYVH